ncbi:MAG: hypothetical protein EXS30_05175 [Pedosphaera sp.]|nr:hypothetical protein [Pedosphaera sp.]
MNRKIISAVAIVVILVSVAALHSSLNGPTADLEPYAAWGWGTAEATAKLLNNQGEIAVIYPRFTHYKIMNPRIKAQLDSFKKALGKESRIAIAIIEPATVDPPSMTKVGLCFSADQFEAISKKHSKASAIVSFVGIPPLTEGNIRAVKEHGAKWVVASDYGPDYKKFLERRVMTLAVVPRTTETLELPKARTLQERFDQEYEVMTADKTPELPQVIR